MFIMINYESSIKISHYQEKFNVYHSIYHLHFFYYFCLLFFCFPLFFGFNLQTFSQSAFALAAQSLLVSFPFAFTTTHAPAPGSASHSPIRSASAETPAPGKMTVQKRWSVSIPFFKTNRWQFFFVLVISVYFQWSFSFKYVKYLKYVYFNCLEIIVQKWNKISSLILSGIKFFLNDK